MGTSSGDKRLRNVFVGSSPLDKFVIQVALHDENELPNFVRFIQTRVNSFVSKYHGRDKAIVKVDGFYGPVTSNRANKISTNQWKRFFGTNEYVKSLLSDISKKQTVQDFGPANPPKIVESFNSLKLTEKSDHEPARMTESRFQISPAFKRLLDKLADGEGTGFNSGKVMQRGYASGYDVTFGYGRYTDGKPKLTEMSLNEIFKLQGKMIANGSISSAVGRYQFIQSTLREQVDKHNIPHDTVFDENVQDFLAVEYALSRGLNAYLKTSGNLKDRKSAILALARIWASVENPFTGRSVYTNSGKVWRPGLGSTQPIATMADDLHPLLMALS